MEDEEDDDDDEDKEKREEPDWIKTERDVFKDQHDKNQDGNLDREEVRAWIIPDDYDHIESEAKHLLQNADIDKVCCCRDRSAAAGTSQRTSTSAQFGCRSRLFLTVLEMQHDVNAYFIVHLTPLINYICMEHLHITGLKKIFCGFQISCSRNFSVFHFIIGWNIRT